MVALAMICVCNCNIQQKVTGPADSILSGWIQAGSMIDLADFAGSKLRDLPECFFTLSVGLCTFVWVFAETIRGLWGSCLWLPQLSLLRRLVHPQASPPWPFRRSHCRRPLGLFRSELTLG